MPQTLLDWLITRYPTAKRQTFKRMLESGRLTVNGQYPKSLRISIAESDVVTVSERAATLAKPTVPFPIIHEDRDVIVIDKPAGLLTSTVPRERRPTAVAMLRDLFPNDRIGLIHRLDRDASGLLVFSKNADAFASLKRQFADHSVDRVYTAIVIGQPNPANGRIESRLVEYADGTVHVSKHPTKGQDAITDYKTVGTKDELSLLRVTLHTGRKHQIRAHLAAKGTPVLNDSVYAKLKPEGRLMLVATELSFDHPRTGKRVSFKLDRPKEMGDW